MYVMGQILQVNGCLLNMVIGYESPQSTLAWVQVQVLIMNVDAGVNTQVS